MDSPLTFLAETVTESRSRQAYTVNTPSIQKMKSRSDCSCTVRPQNDGLQPHSPTFCHWTAVRLSGENKRILWISVGFPQIQRGLREGNRPVQGHNFYAP